MKTHDVNVYQCTWCVHGADNEAALLAHTASKHPTKQPQAYLRVITKKVQLTKKSSSFTFLNTTTILPPVVNVLTLKSYSNHSLTHTFTLHTLQLSSIPSFDKVTPPRRPPLVSFIINTDTNKHTYLPPPRESTY